MGTAGESGSRRPRSRPRAAMSRPMRRKRASRPYPSTYNERFSITSESQRALGRTMRAWVAKFTPISPKRGS